MNTIGRYEITKPLTNENAGFSQWGFGTYDGKKYFIKEFMKPTYPTETKELGEKIVARKKEECEKFIQKKLDVFRKINRASDGNFLKITEFFRNGGKFCIATEALDGIPLESIPRSQRGYILLTFAHSLAKIHNAGLVHGDLKLSNLIFGARGTNFPITHIIDVDGCFQIDDPPVKEDDLVCDQLYMAPEVFRWMCEDEKKTRLTEKIDVFSAGLLIYKILTDELPGISADCKYPYQAVSGGSELDLYRIKDPGIRGVVAQMLAEKPEERPDMGTVFTILRKSILGLGVDEDLSPAKSKSSEERVTAEAFENDVLGKKATSKAPHGSAGEAAKGTGGTGTRGSGLRGDLLRKTAGSTGAGRTPADGRSTRSAGTGRRLEDYFHLPED